MRHLAPVLVMWLTAAAAMAAIGCADGSGPRIDSVMPSSAVPGARIEILGARFCGDNADTQSDGSCVVEPEATITFGADPPVWAPVALLTDAHIGVSVPLSMPPGHTVVVVTVNDVPSNAADFEVK